MIVSKDAYTSSHEGPLGTVGTQMIQYTIRQYRDLRNPKNVLGYMVNCRQRVIIPNHSAYGVGPGNHNTTGYVNYPAAIRNTIALTANNQAAVQVKSIFPVTLNATVNTTQQLQSGDTSSTSNQTSTGSNQSQTNTFGVSLSAGFFGEIPTGGLSADYQHGWESGSFTSNASASEAGRQNTASSGEAMSVKDWSSFGFVDPSNQSPGWVWGQTYPWDVIQYNQSNDGTTIVLPGFVEAALLSNGLLLPPSQLSLFGLDFTMKAGWLVEFPAGISASETVSIAHTTSVYTATHTLNQGNPPTVSAVLQATSQVSPISYASPALDLSTYALDPIWSPSAKNGATIGFTVDPFTFPPAASGGAFKIVSPANNLQVSGTGFEPLAVTNPPTAPAYLTCSPQPSGSQASFTVQFKILDSNNEYHLHLMHWIGPGSSPFMLSLTINGTQLNPFYVDSVRGQGGQNNMTSIELRNLDFQAPNYHDYLVLGLNTVTVAVTAASAGSSNAYTLFAVALGQG